MAEFSYPDPFPLGEDTTEYRLLSSEHVSVETFGDRQMLVVKPEALTLLARQAMRDVSFYLRPAHQEKVPAILKDPEASENDKFVARTLLQNAVVSAEGQLPFCQDTGTATVVAKKGQNIFTGGDDAEALSRGIFQTYTEENLRYSQTVPITMYEEKNSGCNLPAQIDIYATPGEAYKFLFVAKGNRTQQVTDACAKHGGFYLGSIGGPAAILAQNSIRKVEVLDYPELGMEAIWKIEVEDFPAFILVDDKGNDFFKML